MKTPRSGFGKDRHIGMGKRDFCLPARGQGAKRRLGKEDDVGRVVAVAPGLEALVPEHPLGLQNQHTAGV